MHSGMDMWWKLECSDACNSCRARCSGVALQTLASSVMLVAQQHSQRYMHDLDDHDFTFQHKHHAHLQEPNKLLLNLQQLHARCCRVALQSLQRSHCTQQLGSTLQLLLGKGLVCSCHHVQQQELKQVTTTTCVLNTTPASSLTCSSPISSCSTCSSCALGAVGSPCSPSSAAIACSSSAAPSSCCLAKAPSAAGTTSSKSSHATADAMGLPLSTADSSATARSQDVREARGQDVSTAGSIWIVLAIAGSNSTHRKFLTWGVMRCMDIALA